MNPAELSPPLTASDATPDLFERVTALGANGERFGQVLALIGALSFHALFGGAAAAFDRDIARFALEIHDFTVERLRASYEIEVPEEPPKVEEPPAPEPLPEPEKVVVPPDAPVETSPSPEPPVAAAAEAAAVLTQAPDPNEPLDLTGDGFVSGTGTRFAGGTTMANGTAQTAVRATVAAPIGAIGGTGTATPTVVAPKESRARPAALRPGDSWKDCPFPAEADLENINQATVQLVVTVGPDGRAKSVTVLNESSPGFGRAAKKCGLERAFEPGLDDAGKPIVSTMPPFRVRFVR